MEFKRIGRVSVTEETIEYLRQQILSRDLLPGQQLPSEENLAAQLGVGRGTVREALRALVYLGFIERRGKATYITSIAEEKNLPGDFVERIHRHNDVMQVIEIRRIVEPPAAALAAQRASREEVAEIGKNLVAMESHFDRIEDFAGFDAEFHLSVFRASGNPILLELMRSIQQLMRENQALVLRKSGTIQPRSLEFHRRLYEAIRDGREEDARQIMESHVQDIEREMYLIIRDESGQVNGGS